MFVPFFSFYFSFSAELPGWSEIIHSTLSENDILTIQTRKIVPHIFTEPLTDPLNLRYLWNNTRVTDRGLKHVDPRKGPFFELGPR